MKGLGRHLLIELYGCDAKILDDVTLVEDLLVHAAQKAGATVIDSLLHRFAPQGVSGVVVIAESHLAIHTWPEYEYAALDVFTCGDKVDPQDCLNYLKVGFKAEAYDKTLIRRGDRMAPKFQASLNHLGIGKLMPHKPKKKAKKKS